MGNRALKILAGLILAISCFGQGYIQTPPPYWYVVAPPGPLASRPATCTANFHVYICNGAGCTTNGEYHYCTALNTWTVASGADDFVLGRAALPTVGAIPRVIAAGTLGEGGIYDAGAGLIKIGTSTKPAGLNVGSLAMQRLATPTGLSVTPQGTGGAATWTYKGQACLADGVTCTEMSAAVSTTVGNATLDTTNKNRIAWSAVTGATSYIWRRTVSGGTPATLGAFACTTVTATSCDDVGAAGDGVTGPTTNSTGSLLWATDGGGSIGASGANRPAEIYASYYIQSVYIGASSWASFNKLTAFSGNAIQLFSIDASPVLVQLDGTSNSFPGIARSAPNGFAIQSAAGTSTFNDAVTAASGTVAQRRIFHIDGPVLTATNASVTYTDTATMHLGVPTASTNVTFTNPALSLLLDGGIKAAGYLSSDGSPGVTVTTCTGYKNGLCISGT